MIRNEEPLISLDQSKKKHNIPLEHLDFKYVEKCEDVKELEKIYKVLASGIEGKYTELENFVYEKIKRLSPNNRILRKDLPILFKSSIPKTEQQTIDQEMEDFVKNVPNIEKELTSLSVPKIEVPPVRTSQKPVLINVTSQKNENSIQTNKKKETTEQNKSTKKSPKPKDYREWEKIEKNLEKELEDKENEKEAKDEKRDFFENKNNSINFNSKPTYEKLVENLPDKVQIDEELDENVRVLKSDQEKCKGNEAYNAGSYKEALTYYSRSIQYLPNIASYNNRAMTYLKLEMWDKVIDDCQKVLDIEKNNVKALLRRATAYHKRKRFIEAINDINECLKLEPSNNKAQELKKQIESSCKKEAEEVEKVKSSGGNRLKIEDTSGSEDEEQSNKEKENVEKNKKETIEAAAKFSDSLRKKNIKITEVESDDYEEEDNKKEMNKKINDKEDKIIRNNEINIAKKELECEITFEKENNETKIETASKKIPELPSNVIDLKNKANIDFSNGHYGDALNYFTQAINALKQIESKSKDNEELNFYKNNLIILYNNRAKCSQSIGDHKSCIADCNTGLNLVNSFEDSLQDQLKSSKLKLMWKKAYSYEMIEKFADSFIEYEKLMRLDNTFQNVQSHYNRVRNILSQTGELNKVRKNMNNNSLYETNEIKNEDIVTNIVESKEIDIKKIYEEYKEKGNDYFKQNDFKKACEYYTKCIEIDAENTVAYLNRSMCYIKLNEADLAVKDTTVVLDKDDKNVKGLYRRSLANRLKLNYDLVIKDLNKLISIEPNNQIAMKDIKLAQELLLKEKEQLNITSQSSNKAKIQEINSSSTDLKTVYKETITKPNKNKASSEIDTSLVKIEIKPPPKLDTFTNITNAYEFLQAWNSINPNDLDSYAFLISNIDPIKLPKLIGSKLDDDMLTKLITSFHKLATGGKQSKYNLADYLKNMSKITRFDVIKLFMNKTQKELLTEVLKHFDKSDSDSIKNIFGI